MVHSTALPVATVVVFACGGGCFGSEPQTPATPSCCTPPPVEVQVEAKADTPAAITDEHGNPVALRLPDAPAPAGG